MSKVYQMSITLLCFFRSVVIISKGITQCTRKLLDQKRFSITLGYLLSSWYACVMKGFLSIVSIWRAGEKVARHGILKYTSGNNNTKLLARVRSGKPPGIPVRGFGDGMGSELGLY